MIDWILHGSTAVGRAITPRWATRTERGQLIALGVVGSAAADAVLLRIGSWGPPTEALILAGSMLATYGMARGWVEFWPPHTPPNWKERPHE